MKFLILTKNGLWKIILLLIIFSAKYRDIMYHLPCNNFSNEWKKPEFNLRIWKFKQSCPLIKTHSEMYSYKTITLLLLLISHCSGTRISYFYHNNENIANTHNKYLFNFKTILTIIIEFYEIFFTREHDFCFWQITLLCIWHAGKSFVFLFNY